MVAGTWAALRRRAGDGPALLGALTLAVLPYEVSFSDYSRGFELAQLGLVLALWAALALATGGRRRWWWLWIAGGVIAVWSEYVAALVLAGLAAGLFVVIAGPRRREVLLLAAAPVVTLAAWLPEMLRGFDAVDVTKAAPVYPGPSPGQLRDVAAILAFGEHGAADPRPPGGSRPPWSPGSWWRPRSPRGERRRPGGRPPSCSWPWSSPWSGRPYVRSPARTCSPSAT